MMLIIARGGGGMRLEGQVDIQALIAGRVSITSRLQEGV
jgi:hypothetical protein